MTREISKDKITGMLQQNKANAMKRFARDIGDISQGLLYALSTGTGAAGVQQYGMRQQQERRMQRAQNLQEQAFGLKQQSIYRNIMQEGIKRGDMVAKETDKAIKHIVGNDTAAYEKIAGEMQNDPEEVNVGNVNLIASRAANKVGFKSPERKAEDLKLRKAELDLEKHKAQLAGDVATGLDSETVFKREKDLRKEFVARSKEFDSVARAYQRVLKAGANPSAAGDLALIFNYMKMLDPGSTVREGEFATAQNSAAVPDRIRAQYNQITKGQRMAPAQRDDFISRSRSLYEGSLELQTNIENQYKDLSTAYGIDPNRVIVNLRAGEGEKVKTPADDPLGIL